MKTGIKIFMAFLVCSSQFLKADAQGDDVKSLINKAIENYPHLKSQQAAVEMSKSRIDLLHSFNLPVIGAELSYARLDPVSVASLPGKNGEQQEFKFIPNDNYNAQLSVYYPILDFGKTKAGMDKARSEYQLSSDNLENSRFNLAFQVANIYYAIVFYNKSIVVKDAELKLLQENLHVIESKIKYGEALDYDLLSTQVRIADEENQKSDVVNNLNKQITLLNSLTGGDNASLKNASGNFNYDENISFSDSLLQMAYENNYDVKLGMDKLKISDNDVLVNSKNNNPVVALTGGLGIKNGYLPDISKPTPNSLIGASLSVPLFAGNKNDNLYKISKINEQASQFDLDAAKLNVQKDILQLVNDIQNNLEKYHRADTQIRQAQSAVELADSRYKNGVITNLELLNSQTSLILAQLNSLMYQYQLSVSQLELKRLTGQRFW